MINTSNIHMPDLKTGTIRKHSIIKKSLKELDMMDSFLFEAATEDVENAKKIAKIIIERVTGLEVKNLVVETQKQLKGINLDKRGIRMDIYTKETEGKSEYSSEEKTLRVFDIEPNKYYEKDLPRRNRFYQSMIDSKLLASNTTFSELPDVISSWILPYDPFGKDRMLYTVKNHVVECPQIEYNDGVLKFCLYTRGKQGGSMELKNLLTYLENSEETNAVDKDLKEIQDIVEQLKTSSELEERYMGIYGVIDYEKRDSYEEGKLEGKCEVLSGIIKTYKNNGKSKEETKQELIGQFNLEENLVEESLQLYW